MQESTCFFINIQQHERNQNNLITIKNLSWNLLLDTTHLITHMHMLPMEVIYTWVFNDKKTNTNGLGSSMITHMHMLPHSHDSNWISSIKLLKLALFKALALKRTNQNFEAPTKYTTFIQSNWFWISWNWWTQGITRS